jgi:hypothetical protein
MDGIARRNAAGGGNCRYRRPGGGRILRRAEHKGARDAVASSAARPVALEVLARDGRRFLEPAASRAGVPRLDAEQDGWGMLSIVLPRRATTFGAQSRSTNDGMAADHAAKGFRR